MKNVSSILPVLSAAVLVAIQAPTQAAVLVNFNMPVAPTAPSTTAGSPVTQANSVFANYTSGSPSTASITYSATTAIFTPAGTPIYGGMFASFDAPSTQVALRWQNPGSGQGRMDFNSGVGGATPTPATSRTYNGAFLYNLSSPANFGIGSYLQTVGGINATPSSLTLRFLAYNGTNLYVSQSTGPSGGASTVSSLSNPGSINWAIWSPGSDLSFGSLNFNVLGSSITNITKVGVGFNWSATAPAAVNGGISGFQADLIAVPEPSPIALLAAGMAFGAVVAFRRRASAR